MGFASLLEDIQDRYTDYLFSTGWAYLDSGSSETPRNEELIKSIIEICDYYEKQIKVSLAETTIKKYGWEYHIESLSTLSGLLNKYNSEDLLANKGTIGKRLLQKVWPKKSHEIDIFELRKTKDSLYNFCKEREIYGLLSINLSDVIRESIESMQNDILAFQENINRLLKLDICIGEKYKNTLNEINRRIKDDLVSEVFEKQREVLVLLDAFLSYYLEKTLSSPYRPQLQNVDRLLLNKDQEKYVTLQYHDYFRIQGSSGSGKTLILVHRALQIATLHPDLSIRLFTINRSLSKLIASTIRSLHGEVPANIDIASSYDFFVSCISCFEPKNKYRLNDEISKERAAETWDEYFQHKKSYVSSISGERLKRYILSRDSEIDVKNYIFEEMIYMLTCFERGSLERYFDEERKSRFIPLNRAFREIILKIVYDWIEWLEYGNICDPYKLTHDVAGFFLNQESLAVIKSKFPTDCILVDEDQDFSTLELKMLRQLVSDSRYQEKYFFVGDVNQKIYPKHRKPIDAGFDFRGKSQSIRKNYRNTRQILQSAYSIIKKYPPREDDPSLELLDPELSSYDGEKPKIVNIPYLNIKSLIDKVISRRESCSIGIVCPDKKTLFEVRKHLSSNKYAYKELFSNVNLDLEKQNLNNQNEEERIYLSDMEAVKGFEFDNVIICNISYGVFPPSGVHEEDYWRYAAILYTVMTRARDDLFVAYSEKPSVFLNEINGIVRL